MDLAGCPQPIPTTPWDLPHGREEDDYIVTVHTDHIHLLGGPRAEKSAGQTCRRLAIALGVLMALTGLAGPLWAMLGFGLLAAAAGIIYLREDRSRPARYKWAACALAPALVVAVATSPETAPEQGAPEANQPPATTMVSASAPPSTTTEPPKPLHAPAAFQLVDSEGATRALKTLTDIPVRSEASTKDFDSSRFGEQWSDDVTVDGGHNRCDTRNDILRRDLTAVVLDPQSGCTVRTGTLEDVYTGDSASADDVVIDHVVSLSDAWQKGAQDLDAEHLQNFANDPRNLQTVARSVSTEKDGRDASAWLPPNGEYRCTYVARQIDVKAAYQLWASVAEHQALEQELRSCGAIAPATTVPPTSEPASQPAPTTEEFTPPPPAPLPLVVPPHPVAPAPAPAPVHAPDSGYSDSCGPNSYVNADGNCVPGPVQAPTAPAGSTARCNDGTYSFSQNRRGTCSGHGGVSEWV